MSGPQGPIDPMVAAERPINPQVRIGHVHLRTADIDRVRAFYVDIMGFDVVHEARDVPGWGTTGGHPLRLRRWLPPPPRLQHLEVGRCTAPTRRRRRAAPCRAQLLDAAKLAQTVGRLVDAGVLLRTTDRPSTDPRRLPQRSGWNDLELGVGQTAEEVAALGDRPTHRVIDAPFDLETLLASRSTRQTRRTNDPSASVVRRNRSVRKARSAVLADPRAKVAGG